MLSEEGKKNLQEGDIEKTRRESIQVHQKFCNQRGLNLEVLEVTDDLSMVRVRDRNIKSEFWIHADNIVGRATSKSPPITTATIPTEFATPQQTADPQKVEKLLGEYERTLDILAGEASPILQGQVGINILEGASGALIKPFTEDARTAARMGGAPPLAIPESPDYQRLGEPGVYPYDCTKELV